MVNLKNKIREAIVNGLIQDFEADFLWKVSLKNLNSEIILKTFIHVITLWFFRLSLDMNVVIFIHFFIVKSEMFARVSFPETSFRENKILTKW